VYSSWHETACCRGYLEKGMVVFLPPLPAMSCNRTSLGLVCGLLAGLVSLNHCSHAPTIHMPFKIPAEPGHLRDPTYIFAWHPEDATYFRLRSSFTPPACRPNPIKRYRKYLRPIP
jgi:hypothetical protein